MNSSKIMYPHLLKSRMPPVGGNLWGTGRRLALGFLALLTFGNLAMAGQEATLIRDAMIFNALGDRPFRSDVLIQDGRIVKVGKNITADHDRVIEADGLSLLPGLIDVHVHWTAGSGRDRISMAEAFLRHGVTTATDYHSAPESYAPKRQLHEGISSPHVYYIARMSTPGGHGADWGDEHMTRTVVSGWDATQSVKQLAPYRPDAIKVFTDGWRYGSGIDNTSINEDALSSIVEEAKRIDVPVLTHTVTVAGAKVAARSGVATIAHAVQDGAIDAELLALIKNNSVHYAPTLAVYEPNPENLATMPERVRNRVLERQNFSRKNLQKLARNGVKVALGTDSGIGATSFGESTLHELELLVEFGLSPAEALVSGTLNSASALGLADDRGSISAGKRADLILVDGKPWEKISDIRNIEHVFVDGQHLVTGGKLVPAQAPLQVNVEKADALIDDFETEDLVAISGAARLKETDSGFPRSTMLVQTLPTDDKTRVLHIAAKMAIKEGPKASVVLPLSLGSFTPRDASHFRGLRFMAKGEGDYEVQIETEAGTFSGYFGAGSDWGLKEIPFEDFIPEEENSQSVVAKVYAIKIGAGREAGESYWLQIDDVAFF